ncbi:MAG: hypothetical protein GXP35_06645 [Actinobacteria bacterium]|nr:hypothetical protein [Actinomycetota bacterium]
MDLEQESARLVRGRVPIAGAVIIAVAILGGVWLVTRSDDPTLADHLESRLVDGLVYPAFRVGDGGGEIDGPSLMYGQAESLLAVAGLQTDEYERVSADVVESLESLGTDHFLGPATAALLMGLPGPAPNDAARRYIGRYLASLDVDPDDYQNYAPVSGVVRSRFWTTQSAGIDPGAFGILPPSCTAVADALADGQLGSIGWLAVVDPTVRQRCGHKEFSLDSVLDGSLPAHFDAFPAQFVEALALHEAGWITDAALSQFQSELVSEIAFYRASDPFWLSLGVGLGLSEPGDAQVFEDSLTAARAKASGQGAIGPDALSLWLMQDIAKLAGTQLAVESSRARNGLTGAELAVLQIMGEDVEGIAIRTARNPEFSIHYWMMAIDLVDATGSCGGLDVVAPEPSTPLITEAYEYVAAVCGLNFADFDDLELSVAQVAEPVLGMAQSFDSQRATSRALRCRLGLSPSLPEERAAPYPTDLWALWTVAVLTEDCA